MHEDIDPRDQNEEWSALLDDFRTLDARRQQAGTPEQIE
jgi:hypothetical protein